MSDELWTLPQLAREIGIEYRTAKVWQERGIIHASVYTTEGTGRPSQFTAEDVEQARVAADLRRAGIEAATLERIVVAEQARQTPTARYVRLTQNIIDALAEGDSSYNDVIVARYGLAAQPGWHGHPA